jgi:hypothetical protein
MALYVRMSARVPFLSLDIDDCENIICLNGGTCIDGVNTYNCDCAEGYTGQTCETGMFII